MPTLLGAQRPIYTCASSSVHLTASATGEAAEQATEGRSERTKYSTPPATHDFIPVTIESLGPINSSC